MPDQWITVKVEENPQRIMNYAQDKRRSNEIWVESTWLNIIGCYWMQHKPDDYQQWQLEFENRKLKT